MNNDLTTPLNVSGAERNGMIAIANNGINAVVQFKSLAGDFDTFLNQITPQTEPQAFGRRAAIRAAHDRSKASASGTSGYTRAPEIRRPRGDGTVGIREQPELTFADSSPISRPPRPYLASISPTQFSMVELGAMTR